MLFNSLKRWVSLKRQIDSLPDFSMNKLNRAFNDISNGIDVQHLTKLNEKSRAMLKETPHAAPKYYEHKTNPCL